MDTLKDALDERVSEIDAYLVLLDDIDKKVIQAPPRGENSELSVTSTQQRMLYSAVYLQLYNLVESTVTACFDAIADAIAEDECTPGGLSEKLRREWVRFIARTHVDLNFENRLEAAWALCSALVQDIPVDSEFRISGGGSGNWDDKQIEKTADRLGILLGISQGVKESIKRPFRNDQGALSYIKNTRNNLAHGSVSFVECSQNDTISDLRDLANITFRYLDEVVVVFQTYIQSREFRLQGTQ